MAPDDISIIERYEELRDLFDKMMVYFECIKIDNTALFRNYIGIELYINEVRYKLFYNHIVVETFYKTRDISVGGSRVIPYLRNINEKLEMYLIYLSVFHTIVVNRQFSWHL